MKDDLPIRSCLVLSHLIHVGNPQIPLIFVYYVYPSGIKVSSIFVTLLSKHKLFFGKLFWNPNIYIVILVPESPQLSSNNYP
uniref:Uncharacterized protein n=1 Tax=Megaselia scalaris TaxID=36166 RepID=T1GFE9_MEGSC